MTYTIIFEEVINVLKKSKAIVEAKSKDEAIDLLCSGEYEEIELLNEEPLDTIEFEILSAEKINDSNDK